MGTLVDLRALAFERAPRVTLVRPRSLLTRYVLPCVILGTFAGVVLWSIRDSVWQAKPVTVVSVVARRGDVSAANTPLFQAAGWVEPRPQPVVVSALVEGIVDEILVVEGQAVEAGQVVARLVRRDAEIAVERATAEVRLRKAELLSAQAGLKSAEALFEEPIPLLASLADADAALAKMETELARLPSLVRGAEAKRVVAEQEVASKGRTPGTVPAIAVRRAESELETALAQLDEFKQQKTSYQRERQALAKRRDVLQRQLELKIDETRRVAEAKAGIEVAAARVEQSIAARDAAQLTLERTEVRAKSGGQVLALIAKPGSRLMGVERAATYDASTVLTMYNPQSLQIRADVRLDDVSRVTSGQLVRIETAAYATPLNGRVLMATALTDIQKNTLQVKLAIDNPPRILKPDMLVQVTFLAAPRTGSVNASPALCLFVPRELIQNAANEAAVWIADQSMSVARLRRVTVGTTTTDGLVEITTGVNVGDRLIVNGRETLEDGELIRIAGLDPTLGREPAKAIKTDTVRGKNQAN